MKRTICMLVFAALLIAFGIGGNSTKVSAGGDFTKTELNKTIVEDITVATNDYIINKLDINTTWPDNKDGYQIYKFSIEDDGYVKLLLACRNVDKITERYGKTTSHSKTDSSMSATIYRDAGLLYPIGTTISAKADTKGEFLQPIALDKGTYYIAIKTDKYSASESNGTTTTTYVLGKAELIVYYQKVVDYETYRPSIAGKENDLKMEAEFLGFLTATNPKDYYKFDITDKAMVKFNFMYNSKNKAKFTLYSTDREVLLTQTVDGGNVWYNVEKYLEPGSYYCSLETTTVNDGGETRLLLNQTVYALNLTKVNETVNTYVTVETIDDPVDVRYVLGKLTNSELKSAKWNKGKVITDSLQFGVNKTGYYTVRVTDQYGNMFMQSIKIEECDKKPPKKPTIKTYKADTFVVSGTAESNSFVTVWVNGKAYTCTANSKGAFNCTLPTKLVKGSFIEVSAQDISGNISEKAEAEVK